MKKIVLIFMILLFTATLGLFAQTKGDFKYFGDNRAALAGPNLIDSFYTENPAATARTIHNSISLSYGLHLAKINFDNVLSNFNNYGLFYALCIPNFTLVNAFAKTDTLDANSSQVNGTKNLLGVQLGFSNLDFGLDLPFYIAGGAGVYRLSDVVTQKTTSVTMDAGFSAALSAFRFDFLAKNLIVNSDTTGFSFAGDRADYSLTMASKLILEVKYELGFSTARDYADIDYILGFLLKRSFFSNSLNTGFKIDFFIDPEYSFTTIPVVHYALSASYLFPDIALFKEAKDEVELSRYLFGLFHGLGISFKAKMCVNNFENSQSVIPIISFGVSKFF